MLGAVTVHHHNVEGVPKGGGNGGPSSPVEESQSAAGSTSYTRSGTAKEEIGEGTEASAQLRGKTMLPLPLWYLMVNNSLFRSEVQRVLVEASFPLRCADDTSQPGGASRPHTAMQLRRAGAVQSQRPTSAAQARDATGTSDTVRIPPSEVASDDFRFRMWLSKARGLDPSQRYLEVSKAVREIYERDAEQLHHLTAPPLRSASPTGPSDEPVRAGAVEDGEGCEVSRTTVAKYYKPRLFKPQPLVAHLTADTFIRTKGIHAALGRWWESVPKLRGGDAVGIDTFLHVHALVYSALLYSPLLTSAASMELALEIAQTDWKALHDRDTPLLLNEVLFDVSLLAIVEPWIETFQSEEREHCLNVLHRFVFAPGGTLRKLHVASIRVSSPSRTMPHNSLQSGLVDVVDRLDLIEMHRRGLDATRTKALDLRQWRGNLRSERNGVIQSDRHALCKTRKDIPRPKSSENYALERVLFERLTRRLQQGRNAEDANILKFADSRIIPDDGMTCFVRRHPTVIDRFRAIAETEEEQKAGPSNAGNVPQQSGRASRVALLAKTAAGAPPPSYQQRTPPANAQRYAFRVHRAAPIADRYVRNGTATAQKVIVDALPAATAFQCTLRPHPIAAKRLPL